MEARARFRASARSTKVARMGARRTRQEWSGVVEELEASGDSVQRFCAKHRIRVSTLKSWRWRLRRERSSTDLATPGVRLLPVDVGDVAPLRPMSLSLVVAIFGRRAARRGGDRRRVRGRARLGAALAMLTLPSSVRVYLAAEPVDLRRGHDGLVAIVRSEWKLNPFAGHLSVVFGRRLDGVKILVWDDNGFVLYYKRLSQGRFRMPKVPADATRVELDATTLAMLLDGIDGPLLGRARGARTRAVLSQELGAARSLPALPQREGLRASARAASKEDRARA